MRNYEADAIYYVCEEIRNIEKIWVDEELRTESYNIRSEFLDVSYARVSGMIEAYYKMHFINDERTGVLYTILSSTIKKLEL